MCEKHSVVKNWSRRGFVSDVSEKIIENRYSNLSLAVTDDTV